MRPLQRPLGEPLRRVLVVEDDERLRELLRTVLERAGFAVAEAASGEEALGLNATPDAVVLDVRLPGVSGYEVCRELRDRHGEDLAIIFLSGERIEALDRVAGLLIGADDYLVKPVDPEELLARLRRLLRDPAASEQAPPAPHSELTQRERQVLGLLAGGRTQRQIAAELVISEKTVATHIQRVLEKLGVHTRAQAVAYAYRAGLAGGGVALGAVTQ